MFCNFYYLIYIITWTRYENLNNSKDFSYPQDGAKIIEERSNLHSDKNTLIPDSPKFFDSIMNVIKMDFAGRIKNLFTKDNQSFIEDSQTNTAINTNFIKEVNSPTYIETTVIENRKSINDVLHITISRDKYLQDSENPYIEQKSESLYHPKIDVPFDSIHTQYDNSNYQTINFGIKPYSIMLSPNISNKFRVDEVNEEPESLIQMDDNIITGDVRYGMDAGNHELNVDNSSKNSASTFSRRILTISTEKKVMKEIMSSADKTPSPGLEIKRFKTLIVKPSNKSDHVQTVIRNFII